MSVWKVCRELVKDYLRPCHNSMGCASHTFQILGAKEICKKSISINRELIESSSSEQALHK